VPQNTSGRRLLPKCFKPSELEFLNQQPEFSAAISRMQTIEDFEQAVTLGHRLLLERSGIHPAKFPVRPQSN
jgi:hypothetical protein